MGLNSIMGLIWLSLVMGAVLGGSTGLSAEVNLVERAWKIQKDRCADREVPPKECKRLQKLATKACGLNATEIKYQKDNGLYSSCLESRQIQAVCPCGCFDVGTRIATAASPEGVPIEYLKLDDQVEVIDENASLSNLFYRPLDLAYIVSGDEDIPLYVLSGQDASGQTYSIALTQHHGVLLSDGHMTTAKEVNPGEMMLSANGEVVVITSVNRRTTTGKVYNFLTKGSLDDVTSHLVIANDLIVGDIIWQNTYADRLNEIALRQ